MAFNFLKPTQSAYILLGICLLSLGGLGCRSADRGQIAYVGRDGNVYLTSADLSTTTQLTTDATIGIEGAGRSYHRLAWSPKGQLAYASVERTGDSSTSELYVTTDQQAIPPIVGSSPDHFVIYINWAAGSCDHAVCKRLGYLIEEDENIALRTVEVDAAQNRVAGVGWPFYFSWSADGQRMLWHRNGGVIDSSAATYSLYDVATRQAIAAMVEPGLQVAPAFSPTGDAMLLVSADNKLQLIEGDRQTTLTNGEGADTAYVWSPDGTQIAYAVRIQPREPFFDAIYVYDLESGESRRVIEVGLRNQGFFWAPDSRQLAYIQWLPLGDEEGWMQWRVVDTATGDDRGFEPFNPTPQFRFIMASFTQYAQSHRLWSPDSRYLLFTERRLGSGDKIWLLDTHQARENGIFVADGSLAFWSWE